MTWCHCRPLPDIVEFSLIIINHAPFCIKLSLLRVCWSVSQSVSHSGNSYRNDVMSIIILIGQQGAVSGRLSIRANKEARGMSIEWVCKIRCIQTMFCVTDGHGLLLFGCARVWSDRKNIYK